MTSRSRADCYCAMCEGRRLAAHAGRMLDAHAFELTRVLGEGCGITRSRDRCRRPITQAEYHEAEQVALRERARLAALVVV